MVKGSINSFCTNEEKPKMSIPNSKEADFLTKRDEEEKNDGNKITKGSSSSTSRLRFKDPRIVRVSRAFGGKDRHSKVCTVKGLRDRRVRLSVPTAIQLYDLQDRLGLNQPSKVVDWLLNAAKDEIDELPPLPITPNTFGLNPQSLMLPREGIKINTSMDWDGPSELSKSSFWNCGALWKGKSKEIAREKMVEKEGNGLDISSNSYFPSLMNNCYSHLESSNFPLSHMGSHGFRSQGDDFNFVPLPSTLSLSTTQTYFPSHIVSSLDIDPRQHANHFPLMSSSSQNLLSNSLTPSLYSISPSMRSNISFPFNVASRPNISQERSGNQQNKDQVFPSK